MSSPTLRRSTVHSPLDPANLAGMDEAELQERIDEVDRKIARLAARRRTSADRQRDVDEDGARGGLLLDIHLRHFVLHLVHRLEVQIAGGWMSGLNYRVTWEVSLKIILSKAVLRRLFCQDGRPIGLVLRRPIWFETVLRRLFSWLNVVKAEPVVSM